MTYKSKPYKEPKDPVGTVAELFAGVGGFRIGLARAGWKTVFSNQWEPSTKVQHASDVYMARFGEDGHSNEDISKVEKIPRKFDLMVGGFPCQDYSVAKTLKSAKGIKGKKGVLWWEILRLVERHQPKFIFLENVDRLLKSPSSQRGRDFAVMLRTLGDAGYAIEWRVINAAEYGFPQRRIRVFIVARKIKSFPKSAKPFEIITSTGILARALPVISAHLDCYQFDIDKDVEKVSRYFNKKSSNTPFLNSGLYINGRVYTLKTEPFVKKLNFLTLGDVLVPESEVEENFYVPERQIKEWRYLKGAKSVERIHQASGTKYKYTEGSMAFPDLSTNPSRTILTGEGGTSPSRFKHIIETPRGYRRLTPVELERLNGFPDNWTEIDNKKNRVPDTKRAFFMGNALVIGLIEKVGKVLAEEIQKTKLSKTCAEILQ